MPKDLKMYAPDVDPSKNPKMLDTDILLSLIGSLQGCAQSNPMAGGNYRYKEGDQVCYTEGATNIPITLLENVTPEQMTVMATRPNGSRVMATTDYLSDISNCMRGGK